jgi:hypothetical protein
MRHCSWTSAIRSCGIGARVPLRKAGRQEEVETMPASSLRVGAAGMASSWTSPSPASRSSAFQRSSHQPFSCSCLPAFLGGTLPAPAIIPSLPAWLRPRRVGTFVNNPGWRRALPRGGTEAWNNSGAIPYTSAVLPTRQVPEGCVEHQPRAEACSDQRGAGHRGKPRRNPRPNRRSQA